MPNLADLAPPAIDPATLEIIGRLVIDEIVTDGLDTADALEGAMFRLTEWLTSLDTQPGDEVIVLRRKETR